MRIDVKKGLCEKVIKRWKGENIVFIILRAKI